MSAPAIFDFWAGTMPPALRDEIERSHAEAIEQRRRMTAAAAKGTRELMLTAEAIVAEGERTHPKPAGAK